MVIYIRYSGGLGNQMHQFSLAYIISLKFNVNKIYFDDLFYSLSYLNKKITRRRLIIEKEIIPNYQYNIFVTFLVCLFSICSRLSIIKSLLLRFGIYKRLNLSDDFTKLNKFLIVDCNEILGKYNIYEEYESEVKYLWRSYFKNKFINRKFKLSENTIIHIRRTDYLNKESVHVVLPEKYYYKALNQIKCNKFYIKGDDINWNRENFISMGGIYLDGDSIDDFIDLMISKTLIISNSTFAWWAAYLNINNADVYCPNNWIKNIALDIASIYPRNWKKVNYE